MLSKVKRKWFLPIIIIIGVLCLLFAGNKAGSSVNVQRQPQCSADSGILVVPVQIARDSYGIAMVDTIGQTMWVYELDSRGPNHLNLLAARSWQ